MSKTVTTEEVFASIQELTSDQLGVNLDQVQLTSNIEADLGADSLDRVELVMALEEEFDMEIPDEVAEKLTTIQEVVDLVVKHKNA